MIVIGIMDAKIENIIENIISLKPLLFKKLVNRDIAGGIIPHGSQFILMMLEKKDTATMSEIGKELCIPNPNVTPLVDKLVENQMVERTSDSNDRRIVRIKITPKGSDAIIQAKDLMKSFIKSKLTLLPESDLENLASSLNTIKEVIQKIQ